MRKPLGDITNELKGGRTESKPKTLGCRLLEKRCKKEHEQPEKRHQCQYGKSQDFDEQSDKWLRKRDLLQDLLQCCQELRELWKDNHSDFVPDAPWTCRLEEDCLEEPNLEEEIDIFESSGDDETSESRSVLQPAGERRAGKDRGDPPSRRSPCSPADERRLEEAQEIFQEKEELGVAVTAATRFLRVQHLDAERSRPVPQRILTKLGDDQRVLTVDWLLETCHVMRFPKVVAFTALGLLDRYVQKESVQEQIQVTTLAVTSIALKLHGVSQVPVSLKEILAHLGQHRVPVKHIFQKERQVLDALGFRISAPTVLDVLALLAATCAKEGSCGHCGACDQSALQEFS